MMLTHKLSRRTVLAGAATLMLAATASRALAAVMPQLSAKDGSFDRVKAAKILKFGTSNDQPYSFVNVETGKIEGIDAEMMLAILDKLGIPDHEATQIEFNGLIPSLLASRMDVIADAMYITEKRQKVISFSEGWYQYGEALLVREGNPKGLHALEDLKSGAKVGSYLGTVYLDWLGQIDGAEVMSYPDAASALEDMRAGRLDAVVIDAPVAGYALSHNPKYKNAFEIVADYKPREVGTIGAGFRKEDEALREAFNWALKELKAEGTDLAILKKWGLSEANRALG